MSSTNARQKFKLGKQAEKQHDFEAAKAFYSEGLDLDPDASVADWEMLNKTPRAFPERRAIRAMLRIRLADFTRNAYNESSKFGEDFQNPKVFMYWGQGFDAAPPIVQSALRSTIAHHGRENVVLIDDSNAHEWVNFPDRIWEIGKKYRTAFSDLLRVELLAEHGGIWSDATCFSTESALGKFESMTNESGFFAFGKGSPGVISSWFMASRPHSYIACMMRDAMRLYWSVYDRPITYYYMHQIWLQLYRMDDRFRAYADRIPNLGVDPRAVNRAMLRQRSEVDVSSLLDGSFVHKLTYKNPPELVTKDTVAHYMTTI
ncbi:capsular polysaccharide synthesis protein [Glutamicibacter sp. NPDC087344]|uniref:capsular polysaccharide synthesis protein n=1 Tax=Glutamicibacter sp. NPDC087344 TaxID=3363994 RepID=UPI00380CAE22